MSQTFDSAFAAQDRPVYVAPSVDTLTEDEVLDNVGPAQAYTGNLPFGF
jgi:hypothetical protein